MVSLSNFGKVPKIPIAVRSVTIPERSRDSESDCTSHFLQEKRKYKSSSLCRNVKVFRKAENASLAFVRGTLSSRYSR